MVCNTEGDLGQGCVGIAVNLLGKNTIFPLAKVRLGSWGNPFGLGIGGGALRREASFVIWEAKRI